MVVVKVVEVSDHVEEEEEEVVEECLVLLLKCLL